MESLISDGTLKASRPPTYVCSCVADIIKLLNEAKFSHLLANQNIQNINYVFLSSYPIVESAFGLEWCSLRLLPIGTYLHPMPDPDLRVAALTQCAPLARPHVTTPERSSFRLERDLRDRKVLMETRNT